MINLIGLAGVCAGAAAAASLTLAACGGSETTDTPAEDAIRAPTPTTARAVAGERARRVIEDCSTRSEASFPGAFSDQDNVVAGPLVLVGAAKTPASTVREFGGDKIMALVKAGHRVRVTLSQRTRRVASLGYGPLPEGVELSHRDGHQAMTFISCKPGDRSGSTVDGQPVTFWSGFVFTSAPRCVPLAVWVDDTPSPRRMALRMGVRRCTRRGRSP